MQRRRPAALHLLLPILLLLGITGVPASPLFQRCVALQGIESGGGEGMIDLDAVKVSLEKQPFDISNEIIGTVAGCSSGLETPISMRNLLGTDSAVFSVASMFHPEQTALDIFGDKETSDARRRCQPDQNQDDQDATFLMDMHMRVAIIYTLVYGPIQGMPYCLEQIEPLMEKAGHPISLLEGEPSVETPWGLAKAYVDEVTAFLARNDGWNADGSLSRGFNRVPFSDFAITDSAGNSWEKYVPQNSPYKFTKKKKWQPLLESDGLGYTSCQEHVVPHIGMTARFFGFNSSEDEKVFASRQVPRRSYINRYEALAKDAIQESRCTARDAFKQAAISFFDNKFGSLIPLKAAYFTLPDTALTALEFYRLTVKVQLAIYNSIVLVWREKIRHDAPRPPSIVRWKLGERSVKTYAGPGQGVKSIKASEWEPFVRTMPHSEYPSASACICQVFAEQLQLHFDSDGINPPLELGPFSFSSWSEISQVCGDSRVWGGMHFEGSVPAGASLCGGGLMAESISASIDRLIDGDESAAIFKKDIGELMVRPLK